MQPFQWVMAPLCGVWVSAWFLGQDSNGRFLVEFSDDGPVRAVDEIRPIVA